MAKKRKTTKKKSPAKKSTKKKAKKSPKKKTQKANEEISIPVQLVKDDGNAKGDASTKRSKSVSRRRPKSRRASSRIGKTTPQIGSEKPVSMKNLEPRKPEVGLDFSVDAEDEYVIPKRKKTVQGLEKRGERVISKGDDPSLNLNAKNKIKKNRKKILIAIGVILGIAAIIGIVSAILMLRTPSFTGDNARFSVKAPETLTSGSSIEYIVALENKEKVPFEDVAIDIVYPENFDITSVSPKAQNFNKSNWTQKTLDPNQKLEIKIQGVLFGEENDIKTLSARLTYKPKNVGSSFTETKELQTTLEGIEATLQLDAPESVTAGSEFATTIDVASLSKQELKNVRIKLTYPEEFEFKTSEPAATFGNDAFDFQTFNALSSKKIEITGVLSGEVNDENKIIAALGFYNDNNEFIQLEEKEVNVTIGKVVAEVETKVSNQKENALSAGELLEYTVAYKNSGTEVFNEVSIETQIDGAFIDTDTFQIDKGKYEDGKVIWTQETVSELEVLNPDDEGELSFSVKVLDTLPVNSEEDLNYTIQATSTFKAKGTEGNPDTEISVQGESATTKLNSEISIEPELHYYDFEGLKVGSGPLPPVIGEKTTYRLYVLVSNKANELDSGEIRIKLPEYTSFGVNKDANVGEITLEDTKTAIWKIGKIPAHTGRFSEGIEAYIDVIFTPTEEQLGTDVIITNGVSYTGVDAFTEQDIEKSGTNVTTDLVDDPFAQNKGIVVSEEEANTAENSSNPFDSTKLNTETE